jgi:hypothetical protein
MPPLQTSEWTGDERRQSQRGLDEIYDRLNKGGERMDKMDAEIERNTRLTESIDANTRDLIALFRSWAGAFKTIEQIGSLARPVAYCAMAVAAIAGAITAVKTGSWFK